MYNVVFLDLQCARVLVDMDLSRRLFDEIMVERDGYDKFFEFLLSFSFD